MSHEPFKGLVFCHTGLEESKHDHLASIVKGMGGIMQQHLGVDTNCLVIGRRWSEKYNFALRSRTDIRFLDYKKLALLSVKWRAGGDIDINQELERAQLGAFQNLRICATQMSESDKDAFKQIIRENGEGYFTTTLTQQVDVVISRKSQGKKVEYAQTWQIPVVHPDWIVESVRVGAALPPKMFTLDLDESQRNASAIRPRSAVSPELVQERPLMVKAQKRVSSSFSGQKLAGLGRAALSFNQDHTKKAKIESNSLMLQNRSFALHDFSTEQYALLERAVTSHGGQIEGANAGYTIVKQFSPKADPPIEGKVITEWAIERSLFKSRCCLDDVWSEHVALDQSTRTLLQDKEISITGFDGVEIRHLEKLIVETGAKFIESLTADRHFLIAASLNTRKATFAKRWGVPIVTFEWLWDSIKTQKVQNTEDYKLESTELKREQTSSDSVLFEALNEPEAESNYADDNKAKTQLLKALGETSKATKPTEKQTMPAVDEPKRRMTARSRNRGV